MVTASGIILGFVFSFAGSWAKDPSVHASVTDYIITIGLVAGITLLILTLFRVLNNNYPTETAGQYYHRTLYIFTSGVILSFAGIVIAIIQELL